MRSVIIHPKEFETVINLSTTKSYEYFLKTIVGFGELWGLSNEGWATTENDDGKILIPFWPKKEFAKANISDEWSSYIPEVIDLDEFLEDWIPGMINEGHSASVFRTPNGDYIEVDLIKLKDDLENELRKY